MAIELARELKDSGVTANYNVITRVSNFDFTSGSAHIGSYLSAETRAAGKNYIGFDEPTEIKLTKEQSDTIKGILYTALMAMPGWEKSKAV